MYLTTKLCVDLEVVYVEFYPRTRPFSTVSYVTTLHNNTVIHWRSWRDWLLLSFRKGRTFSSCTLYTQYTFIRKLRPLSSRRFKSTINQCQLTLLKHLEHILEHWFSLKQTRFVVLTLTCYPLIFHESLSYYLLLESSSLNETSVIFAFSF